MFNRRKLIKLAALAPLAVFFNRREVNGETFETKEIELSTEKHYLISVKAPAPLHITAQELKRFADVLKEKGISATLTNCDFNVYEIKKQK